MLAWEPPTLQRISSSGEAQGGFIDFLDENFEIAGIPIGAISV